MLKKLVKYGNSNAIVLDKAILELLEIHEGSLVKIKTDGTSIIITPSAKHEEKTVSLTGDEGFRHVIGEYAQEVAQNPSLNTITAAQVDKTMYAELQERFGTIGKKYQPILDRLESNPLFQDELKDLTYVYQKNNQKQLYLQKLQELKVKYEPELADMDYEIKKAVDSCEL